MVKVKTRSIKLLLELVPAEIWQMIADFLPGTERMKLVVLLEHDLQKCHFISVINVAHNTRNVLSQWPFWYIISNFVQHPELCHTIRRIAITNGFPEEPSLFLKNQLALSISQIAKHARQLYEFSLEPGIPCGNIKFELPETVRFLQASSEVIRTVSANSLRALYLVIASPINWILEKLSEKLRFLSLSFYPQFKDHPNFPELNITKLKTLTLIHAKLGIWRFPNLPNLYSLRLHWCPGSERFISELLLRNEIPLKILATTTDTKTWIQYELNSRLSLSSLEALGIEFTDPANDYDKLLPRIRNLEILWVEDADKSANALYRKLQTIGEKYRRLIILSIVVEELDLVGPQADSLRQPLNILNNLRNLKTLTITGFRHRGELVQKYSAGLLAWPIVKPGTSLNVRLGDKVWRASRSGRRSERRRPNMTRLDEQNMSPNNYRRIFDRFSHIEKKAQEGFDSDIFMSMLNSAPSGYPFEVPVFF